MLSPTPHKQATIRVAFLVMLFAFLPFLLAVNSTPVAAQAWCTFLPVTLTPPTPVQGFFTIGGVCCIEITWTCQCNYTPGQQCNFTLTDPNGYTVWTYAWDCQSHPCPGPFYVCLWTAGKYKIESSFLCDASSVTVAPAPANTNECANCHP